jgi:hypothetical protein
MWKKPAILSATFLLSVLAIHINAQYTGEEEIEELYRSLVEKYGPDQNLVSGVRYYDLHSRYDGHKYFGDNRFTEGKLFLNSGTYEDVSLKYDLYEQQVILQVSLSDLSYTEIVVAGFRIQGFKLGDRVFRKACFPRTDTLIFQVIGEEVPQCYLHWSKEVIPHSTDRQSVYEFSKMKRKTYVVIDSQLYRFKGARSFSKAFPGHRAEVMSYIRKNKIRINKAGDRELEALTGFCHDLLKEGGDR